MNKLVIPAILAATVLVAGMFAFMPVEKASTVHTSIQASTTKLVVVSGTCNTDGPTGGDDGVIEDVCNASLNIQAGVPFSAIGLQMSATNLDDTEVIDTGCIIATGTGALGVISLGELIDAGDPNDQDPANAKSFGIGIGPGSLTCDMEFPFSNAGTADALDEIYTLDILLEMPADAPTPTMSFS